VEADEMASIVKKKANKLAAHGRLNRPTDRTSVGEAVGEPETNLLDVKVS
jgi:hypothetical protein